MKETLQGIVLGCVRHSDRTSVLTVYTATRGTVALVVPAGSSAKGRTRAAVRMPLALVEFSCDFSGAKELRRPSGLTLRRPYGSLYFHPVKSAIGIFLAEFLLRLLREMPPDAGLFAYIERALLVLDSLERSAQIANFHLIFLARLLGPLGVEPDLSRPSPIFDLRAARYVAAPPLHTDVLTGAEARVPLLLERIDFTRLGLLRLNREGRRRLLEGLLGYYAIHLPGLGRLKSPAVLAEIFG